MPSVNWLACGIYSQEHFAKCWLFIISLVKKSLRGGDRQQAEREMMRQGLELSAHKETGLSPNLEYTLDMESITEPAKIFFTAKNKLAALSG